MIYIKKIQELYNKRFPKTPIVADGIIGKKTIKAIQEMTGFNDVQVVHFMAQCDHESGGFTTIRENLNYSASGLRKTFSKYFPNDSIANQYARKPEKIANRVYANRFMNGDEASGDGWKYSGFGLIQLTFRENHERYGADKEDGWFDGSVSYFKKNSAHLAKDFSEDTLKKVTKSINGLYNGLDDRRVKTEKYKKFI